MNVLSIECSRCGSNAQLPVSSFFVQVSGPELVDDRMGGSVHWICATCADLVAATIDWGSLLSLVSAGVPVVDEEYDDVRPMHPEHPSEGAPLTDDDLLDLHALLARPDWFDQFSAPVDSARLEGQA
jgi:hypothetical protein